jgi:hypothetical protein
MKITIIGSMDFYEKYLELKKQLKKIGHIVKIPLPDKFYEKSGKIKIDSMKDFNNNLTWSDAILIANYEKNKIKNYIGINSIMEIGMAFNRNKKIFILFEIPDNCKEEFKAINVIELKEDLSKIK